MVFENISTDMVFENLPFIFPPIWCLKIFPLDMVFENLAFKFPLTWCLKMFPPIWCLKSYHLNSPIWCWKIFPDMVFKIYLLYFPRYGV